MADQNLVLQTCHNGVPMIRTPGFWLHGATCWKLSLEFTESLDKIYWMRLSDWRKRSQHKFTTPPLDDLKNAIHLRTLTADRVTELSSQQSAKFSSKPLHFIKQQTGDKTHIGQPEPSPSTCQSVVTTGWYTTPTMKQHTSRQPTLTTYTYPRSPSPPYLSYTHCPLLLKGHTSCPYP